MRDCGPSAAAATCRRCCLPPLERRRRPSSRRRWIRQPRMGAWFSGPYHFAHDAWQELTGHPFRDDVSVCTLLQHCAPDLSSRLVHACCSCVALLQPFTEADWQAHITWRRYIPEPSVSGVAGKQLWGREWKGDWFACPHAPPAAGAAAGVWHRHHLAGADMGLERVCLGSGWPVCDICGGRTASLFVGSVSSLCGAPRPLTPWLPAACLPWCSRRGGPI